jgi:tetratricopeptide (TPR) repeat protein
VLERGVRRAGHPPNRGTPTAVGVLLVVVTLAVFAPVLRNDFTSYDDRTYVSANRHIQHGVSAEAVRWAFTTTRAANWHPLTWISHTLDWSLYGANPRGHHLTSLILHVADVVLLFALLGRVTGAWGPAGFAAALFAIHPLHVESVAWIAERKDVLSTLFWLLATWAYFDYVKSPSKGRLALVAFLMALGLLAKPMLVTLPFTLLLLDRWPLGRASAGWKALVVEKLPLFALSIAACVVTFLAQRAGGAVASVERFPAAARVANAIWSYVAYLEMAVWPRRLAVFYPHPGSSLPAWKVGFAAAILAALTSLAVRLRRSRPYVLTGWLWYVGTLVPVVGLVQVGNQGMADRYTYVPLIGIFVIVAWTAAGWGRRATIPVVAVVLALAAVARAQVMTWRDTVTLFTHALSVTGPNPTALVNLGAALEDRGKIADAMARYDEALGMDPGNRIAENRAAGVLAAQGRLDEAVGRYREALRRNPGDPDTLSNLGIALGKQRKLDEAIVRFQSALDAHPDDPSAILTNLGNALLLSGRTEEAIARYDESLRLAPGDPETLANLAVARRALGRTKSPVEPRP